jgi:hypothetical protein
MMQPHSITSSARAANPGGTSMPSRFAVCANWFTPQELRRSLTWDRGREMADHKSFTVTTNVQVYLCDLPSPWRRGSNENTNGLLRQYFPSRYWGNSGQVRAGALTSEVANDPKRMLATLQRPIAPLAALLLSGQFRLSTGGNPCTGPTISASTICR